MHKTNLGYEAEQQAAGLEEIELGPPAATLFRGMRATAEWQHHVPIWAVDAPLPAQAGECRGGPNFALLRSVTEGGW